MKRSKTAPETIGERLRKSREKLGLSVDEVAKRTKMHPRIVTALEDDQPVDRLSPVYLRSFLRMYARLVGLNEQALLHELDDNYFLLHDSLDDVLDGGFWLDRCFWW